MGPQLAAARKYGKVPAPKASAPRLRQLWLDRSAVRPRRFASPVDPVTCIALCFNRGDKRPLARSANKPGHRQGKRDDGYGDAAAGMFQEAQRYVGFLGPFHDD